MDRIGGWSVSASATGLPAIAHKAAQANKQHVIYSLSASFSAAPSAPVLVSLVLPDVSPNTVIWQDYLPLTNAPFERNFPAGICIPIGQAVDAVLLANGSLVGKVNLHGNTR